MDFKRSQQLRTCDRYPVYEQINTLTSFVDASMVYGSDEERAEALRTHQAGRLKVNGETHDELPPFEMSECHGGEEQEEEEEEPLFIAGKEHQYNSNDMAIKTLLSQGDERVNENPGLQVMHTLWLKEHNRLAAAIRAAHPFLVDEDIYQEARRYLAAEWQNIVYSEFVPMVVGPTQARKHGFNVDYASEYMDYVQPDILTEFATAAFRFGHTLISEEIKFMNEEYRETEVHSLQDNFFKVCPMVNCPVIL